MPVFERRPLAYKPAKTARVDWRNFRGGLNVLLDETEIAANELAQADNLKAIGRGIPTKREGTQDYFLAGMDGGVELIKGYYSPDEDTNELLAVVGGILTKKSGASYTVVAGASLASGRQAQAVQLGGALYLVDGVNTLMKYDGSTLQSFPTIATPTNVQVTNLSGVSGTRTRSWRVSALGRVGETLASDSVTLGNLPDDPADTTVRISWTAVSAASGDLRGYNIYGRTLGEELLLDTVDSTTTAYEDDGTREENIFAEPPTYNSTGGPIGKTIIKWKDKLIMTDINNPSRILWSAGGTNLEQFHWSKGGGFLDIQKDDGDEIVALHEFQEEVIVFKKRSIWQVTFSADKGVTIPSYKLITAARGAVGPRAVAVVENDLVFFDKDGLFVLGNEPGILGDILRTAEISVKVRPLVDAIPGERLENIAMVYWDRRLWVAYPGADTSKNTRVLVFDRERTSFWGPYDFGAQDWEVYFDTDGPGRLLLGSADDSYVQEVTSAAPSDRGTAFTTVLRTRVESYDSWNLVKVLRDIFIKMRNVRGSISVNIYTISEDGSTTTEKSFSVATQRSTAGLGTDMLGAAQLGISNNAGSTTNLDEVIRWVNLQKDVMGFQVEIKTSNVQDSYELLGIRAEAIAQGRGRLPTSWKI